ncbi:glycosyltransferase family 4 protein [Poseidonibacter ostreae]|uniref:Glycosyltransferase n=1 Tax=Poseidonibacter ostreae TaxID=2654171 RepID=A0ABQ6VPP0_9BACT|nr:glycosyltransferase family 4 protein [Poseidonibacter ostreae]KAB7892674.1 glycosyltransferase [Poseidonibacter ostreae]
MMLSVGPLLPPIHGQSLAFTRFVDSIENEKKIVINTNFEDKTKQGKLIGTFKTILLIAFKATFLKYDVVYFTCSRSFLGSIKDILLINIAILRRVKIVNHLHGSDFYEFLHNSPKWYQKILFSSYNKVNTSIVLLESMKSQFKDFKNMKIIVIPNFYDKELDIKLVKKEKNRINLIYLSNIMSSKGIFELLDAFEELINTYDNIYLTIAGGYIADEFMTISEVKEKFTSKIKGNNLVRYVGKTFGEEKIKLLQRSDIFVLPTYYKSEAFPISILEAMATGNVIVTTNYKYLPDVIKEKNGVLVEPKSVESLSTGIKSVLKNVTKLREIQDYNIIESKRKYSFEKYLENLNKIVFK